MTPDRPDGIQVALLVIEVFESLGVDYHLGGSYASSIHGVPRQTQDVDLVAELRTEHLVPLVSALTPEFYADAEQASEALRRNSSFNLVHLASGIKVDIFCLGPSGFDQSEFLRAKRYQLFGSDAPAVRVKSAEDTVLRKLHWYRMGGETSDRQWADVLGCLVVQEGTLDLAYLRYWAQELQVLDLLDAALVEVAS